MPRYGTARLRRHGVLALVATLGIVLACLHSPPARAIELTDLYKGETIVTGTREPERLEGFRTVLRDVLVKVSGEPKLLTDETTAALLEDAAAHVIDYEYEDRMKGIPVHDEQGTRDRPYYLRVTFDPAKVDALLARRGLSPWDADRPRLAMFLAVRQGSQYYMLTADGPRGANMRAAVAAASRRRGVPVVLPTRDNLDSAGLTVDHLNLVAPDALAGATRAEGADKPLIGSLVWSEEALGWIARWRLSSKGEEKHWEISGVNFDEAFRFAMEGAAAILSGRR